ncbi:meiosis 1 arrest protein-like [Physella acuta]|uniref:meiosis 1 arrest protein-like n=1 Tax=Physella acuta TaxID=109671 RepID=UPI0027DD52BD|nr:meiosis 1 arrest protein-like [Physella acuta]
MSTVKMDESSGRTIMSYQPARTVLLDLSSPLEKQAARAVCEALENTLCMSSRMDGQPRIPLIAIYLLTSYPEVILPLSCTKNNFVRLHAAIEDIRKMLDDGLSERKSKSEEPCLYQAVLESCNQYRRYIASLPQAPINFNQLEVIIVTGKSGDCVHKQLNALPNEADLTVFKRIVSATISSSQPLDVIPENLDVNNFAPSDVSSLVDVFDLQSDPLSLQKFFYNWLIDTSSEYENMHLILPAPSPADQALVLKCDFIERMLSPIQLPFEEYFNLHAESTSCKHIFPTPSKAKGIKVPIYQLKVLKSLDRNTLCESVLFGVPLVVVATACWRMDWELLEKNQHHFHSLCHALTEKDQVLLTQIDDQHNAGSSSSAREWPQPRPQCVNTAPKPAGFFILMPSEHSTMLIKSVVPKELLLPLTQPMSPAAHNVEADLCVRSSLSMVEHLDEFNPLHYESGLCRALKYSSLPKSAVDKTRANKRKNEALQGKSQAKHKPAETKTTGNRLIADPWSYPLMNYAKTAASNVPRHSKH